VVRSVAVGCAPVTAPVNAWSRVSGQRAVVHCNSSSEAWFLTCRDNAWVGQVGNCSSGRSTVAGYHTGITQCISISVTPLMRIIWGLGRLDPGAPGILSSLVHAVGVKPPTAWTRLDKCQGPRGLGPKAQIICCIFQYFQKVLGVNRPLYSIYSCFFVNVHQARITFDQAGWLHSEWLACCMLLYSRFVCLR